VSEVVGEWNEIVSAYNDNNSAMDEIVRKLEQ